MKLMTTRKDGAEVWAYANVLSVMTETKTNGAASILQRICSEMQQLHGHHFVNDRLMATKLARSIAKYKAN